ncbi:MAG: hypothetical protein WCD86_20915 [Ktedonobacteraceae bacterium]
MMHAPQKTAIKYTIAQTLARGNADGTSPCDCKPPALLASSLDERGQALAFDLEQTTPISPELYNHLDKRLNALFPRSTPFSLVLLHVAQIEQAGASALCKPRYYHALPVLLEEALAQIRRSIRRNDYILTHEGVGAALLFPGVDERGIYGIIERIYHNISNMPHESFFSSLKRETVIVMGVGSYPTPAPSVERLLYSAGNTSYRLVLPSAPFIAPWDNRRGQDEEALMWEEDERETGDHLPATFAIEHVYTRLPLSRSAPFMHLPAQIPARLRQLLPYDVAYALQCVPVGRNHHSLTVAMAHPQNTEHVTTLQEVTGLTIFPVSCDVGTLKNLLEQAW